MPTPDDRIPAECLKRYSIVEMLGAGGYGRVYLVKQEALGREVVLKILSQVSLLNPKSIERFILEARLTARLNHPHIVTVVDFGVDEGIPWIVYEHITGGSLSDIIEKSGPDPALAVTMGIQVLQSLEVAHDAGVLHRDLKPSNVMHALERHFKVIDFGTAKSIHQEETKTEAGVLVGTPAYMPPERIRAQEETGLSDIYSFGVMVYRVATGVLPFDNPVHAALLWAHLEAKPPDPVKLLPEIPDELSALMLACLEKRPENRPQTAGELRARFEELVVRHDWLRWGSGSLDLSAVRERLRAMRSQKSLTEMSPPPPTPRPRSRIDMRIPATLGIVVAGLLLAWTKMNQVETVLTQPASMFPEENPLGDNRRIGLSGSAVTEVSSNRDLLRDLADLERRSREQRERRAAMSADYSQDVQTFVVVWKACAEYSVESSRRVSAALKRFETAAVGGQGGPMPGVFLATARGHGFASWAQLWILCEIHHGFIQFNFDHFAKFSALGEKDRDKINELFAGSGLRDWMHGTSADWGTLVFGQFRQQLIGSLEKLKDEELDPAVLPRLAGALHVVSQFTIELAWGRDLVVDALAPEKAFPRGNKESQVRELKLLDDALRKGAARGQGRLAASFAFLHEIWRLGQAQKTMQDLEPQRTRCQNALTVLAGQPSVDDAVIRDLRKLIASR